MSAAGLLVAGGGIGGLAAAVACRQTGCDVTVFEQAQALSETGAGIQLGPNVTRILAKWDLMGALLPACGHPRALVVRDAVSGRETARMEFGERFAARYGAPYLTVHRADLQDILLNAARGRGAKLRTGTRVVNATSTDGEVRVTTDDAEHRAAALVAADGVWSALRSCVVRDGTTRDTGHLAYRALAAQSSLPERLRSSDVTVWLAPRMHLVTYPLRGGDQLNVVALVETTQARSSAVATGWEARGAKDDLSPSMHGLCPDLQELVEALPHWGVWPLHDRAPMRGGGEMASGRIALLGDAAHPMLPYLAQGAGMAIEDADVLASALADADSDSVPAALARYAAARWRRCAQVQAAARRNAAIFHASGAVRVARDTAMRMLGERLIDQPWLYAR